MLMRRLIPPLRVLSFVLLLSANLSSPFTPSAVAVARVRDRQKRTIRCQSGSRYGVTSPLVPGYAARQRHLVLFAEDDSEEQEVDNFDGKGFAGYLAPYAIAVILGLGATGAFFKFVLLDY